MLPSSFLRFRSLIWINYWLEFFQSGLKPGFEIPIENSFRQIFRIESQKFAFFSIRNRKKISDFEPANLISTNVLLLAHSDWMKFINGADWLYFIEASLSTRAIATILYKTYGTRMVLVIFQKIQLSAKLGYCFWLGRKVAPTVNLIRLD